MHPNIYIDGNLIVNDDNSNKFKGGDVKCLKMARHNFKEEIIKVNRKVKLFQYDMWKGKLFFSLGDEKICVTNIEDCFVIGTEKETLVLLSTFIRKKRRNNGEYMDFYYNIKLEFNGNFKILIRGELEKISNG